ncbi:hypothetical protein [Streptomyces sp. NPDC001401]|uniref:hypothetical protein n=1 Tax=Streptomyces sp. NPDC001401 TaxID=3364570 RepID=UPI0036CE6E46
MIKDPHVPWPDGQFPYDVLAPAGVTPYTSHADMKDATFELMQAGLMTPQAQNAHRQLRRLGTRLLADLLFFPVDLPASQLAELPGAKRELDDTADALEDETGRASLPSPPIPSGGRSLAGREASGLSGLAERLIRFDDGTTPYPTPPTPRPGPR